MKRLAICSLLLLPLGLVGGEADKDAHRTRNKKFLIPIELGADRKAVKEARLFVSRDKGKTWNKAQVVPAEEPSFVFEADDNGLYWFALQLAYKDGRVAPADMEFKADLKVLIDPKFVAPEKSIAELEKEIAATRKKLVEMERLLAILRGKAGGDQEMLQGVWRVEKMVIAGEEVPEKDAQEVTIEIKGNNLVMKGGAAIGMRQFTFKLLDKSDPPKGIDLTAVAGPAKGVVVPAIYDVLDDAMLLALPNKETKDRPTEFNAPKGSDLGVFLLRREKAKGKPLDL